MNTKTIARYAATGAAVAAAAVQLSTGSATAATGTIPIMFGVGSDLLGCQATTVRCEISVEVDDVTTPVSIVINGKTMVTALPAPSSAGPGFLVYQWFPDTAGTNTITVTSGSQIRTVTIPIIDNNSPEAFIRRNQDAVRRFACQSGSSAACLSSGVK
ncbi:hypothetical protein ACFV4K_33435 [Nocardia sp. NPDC059764]|uniref:hypothetical protein n=1 Tax=Nocardia sp. NPDC059764 TaxID=3346939 RepID=UPI00364F8085